MPKKYRFAVGSSRPICEVWSVAVSGEDVYAAASSLGNILKVSLHKSGICKYSMREHVIENIVSSCESDKIERDVLRWRRLPTPDIGGVVAFRVVVFSYTSWVADEVYSTGKKVDLIPCIDPDVGAEFCFVFSRNNPKHEILDSERVRFVADLGNETYFSIIAHHIKVTDEFVSRVKSHSTQLKTGFYPTEGVIEFRNYTVHQIVQEYEGHATLYSVQNVIYTS